MKLFFKDSGEYFIKEKEKRKKKKQDKVEKQEAAEQERKRKRLELLKAPKVKKFLKTWNLNSTTGENWRQRGGARKEEEKENTICRFGKVEK